MTAHPILAAMTDEELLDAARDRLAELLIRLSGASLTPDEEDQLCAVLAPRPEVYTIHDLTGREIGELGRVLLPIAESHLGGVR